MHEVQMGNLGAERASDAAVKRHAKKLASDHAKANKELKKLAIRKGITLPDGPEAGGHSGVTSSHTANTQTSSSSSSTPGAPASTLPSTTTQSAGSQSSTQGADARTSATAGARPAGSPGASAEGFGTLTSKSGTDFDREFIRMSVEDHQKDVSEFEEAANKVTDTDLKAWVNKTLPTLRAHLKEAQSLQGKL